MLSKESSAFLRHSCKSLPIRLEMRGTRNALQNGGGRDGDVGRSYCFALYPDTVESIPTGKELEAREPSFEKK